MDDFILYAALAGIGLAMLTGPLGCIVVWRRMAYFGDTLAHSSLLGIALAFYFNISPMIGVIMLGAMIALILVWFQRHHDIATDTMLGILAHSSLALGVVIVAVMQSNGLRIDLLAFLFGDLLTVDMNSILLIYAGVILLVPLIIKLWYPVTAIATHEELAKVEGVDVVKTHLIIMLVISIVVALAIKITGVLLITAMLIIPAAIARRFSSSPEQMAIFSIVIGMLSVILGLITSLNWDTPAGPSIILAASIMFLLTRVSLKQKQ